MSVDIVLHYIATLAYLLLAASIYIKIRFVNPSPRGRLLRQAWLLAILLFHGLAIYQSLALSHNLQVNWAIGLSLMMWLGLLVFWVENLFLDLDNAILPLSAAAAVSCLLSAIYPASNGGVTLPIQNEAFRAHLIIAFVAYSFIILAAIQSLLIFLLELYLRRPPQFLKKYATLNRYIEMQPPLLTQEHLLFRLVGIGFICLTLTLVSGTLINWHNNGTLLLSGHKVIFSLLAWGVFATLLFGRHVWGWRGKASWRWTLAGCIFLMLTYTGTQLVSELIVR